MKEKNKIPAVFKEELVDLLDSIGELTHINDAERFCMVCSKVITVNNLQIIIPRKEKKFEFVCNSPVCIEAYNKQKI